MGVFSKHAVCYNHNFYRTIVFDSPYNLLDGFYPNNVFPAFSLYDNALVILLQNQISPIVTRFGSRLADITEIDIMGEKQFLKLFARHSVNYINAAFKQGSPAVITPDSFHDKVQQCGRNER